MTHDHVSAYAQGVSTNLERESGWGNRAERPRGAGEMHRHRAEGAGAERHSIVDSGMVRAAYASAHARKMHRTTH